MKINKKTRQIKSIKTTFFLIRHSLSFLPLLSHPQDPDHPTRTWVRFFLIGTKERAVANVFTDYDPARRETVCLKIVLELWEVDRTFVLQEADDRPLWVARGWW